MKNATKRAMFALWPMESYGDILGQNHKILLKNRQILKKKMYYHFISTSVLNSCESSYDKCHRLTFLMSHARFVCSIGHFGAKPTDCFYENL
jgi:hypothetical protein